MQPTKYCKSQLRTFPQNYAKEMSATVYKRFIHLMMTFNFAESFWQITQISATSHSPVILSNKQELHIEQIKSYFWQKFFHLHDFSNKLVNISS